MGFPCSSDGKASAYNAGDLGSIPGLGRSTGEGNGNPLQYSCLENPKDGGAQQATVHGITKSWTRLSDLTSMRDCNYFGGSGDNITLNLDSKVVLPMINSTTKFICENHPQLCGCSVTKSCLIPCGPLGPARPLHPWGFLRQGCWSGLPFPSLGDLQDSGTEPESPAQAAGFFTAEPARKPSSVQGLQGAGSRQDLARMLQLLIQGALLYSTENYIQHLEISHNGKY